MRKRINLIWVLGLFCFAAVIFGSPTSGFSAEKVISMDFTMFQPAIHVVTIAHEQWCREVEKRTNGRVKINYYAGGTLAPAEQTYDAVVKGIADIGFAALPYNKGRFPLTEVCDLPLGLKSSVTACRMVNAYYNKFKPKELDDTKVLFLENHGPGLIHSRKPVHTMEDMRGLKVKAAGTQARIINALGGIPVGLPMPDTYDALQKGIVDAVASPYEALQGFRLGEVATYTTEDWGASYVATFGVVMNKERWNSLPPDIQKIIEEVNHEYIDKIGSAWDGCDSDAKKWAVGRGSKIITLSKEENARWADRMKLVFADYLSYAKGKGVPGDQALKFCRDWIQANQK